MFGEGAMNKSAGCSSTSLSGRMTSLEGAGGEGGGGGRVKMPYQHFQVFIC